MTKRFDVCSPRARKEGDKPYWHRVGTAWEGDKGINITFDSLPLPDKEGRVSVALFEAKEKNVPKQEPIEGGRRGIASGAPGSLDDEIPFSAEFR